MASLAWHHAATLAINIVSRSRHLSAADAVPEVEVGTLCVQQDTLPALRLQACVGASQAGWIIYIVQLQIAGVNLSIMLNFATFCQVLSSRVLSLCPTAHRPRFQVRLNTGSVCLASCATCLAEVGAPARGFRVLRVLADADEGVCHLRAQVVAQPDVVKVGRHEDELACRHTAVLCHGGCTQLVCTHTDQTGSAACQQQVWNCKSLGV